MKKNSEPNLIPNQGRRKFLSGGGGVKILKLHWPKRSNTVPNKQNLEQKINDSN